jgi:2-isopropylmalate synthase
MIQSQIETLPSEVNPEANRVHIFDTTLRDGEQSPGIALSIAEKVAIAQQLGKMGVDVIEAGFPINSEGEFKAVQAIARDVEGPVITGLARTHKGDIDKAAAAVVDSENPRIHTFISTSDIHIEHQLKTDREDVKRQAQAGVAHAVQLIGDKGQVEFSPMDATRADRDYTAEVVQIAIDEGATIINIPDTVGYAMPEEYKTLFEFLRREVKGSENVIWSVHCHNDLGLAVANSYAGLQGGARQIEGSINGIGERAGNVALEEIIMLVETRGRYEDGFRTGIDTTQIGPTSRMVSRLTGYPIPANKAVIGRNAFAHESGIHQDGALKERTTYEIMDPGSVGWEGEQIVPGKHSGRHGIVSILEKMPGFDKEAAAKTFDLFKGFRDKRGSVSKEQLVEIHEEAKRRIASGYEIHDYRIEASEDKKKAYVSLINNETGKQTESRAESDEGQTNIDGSVAAIIAAIAYANGVNYEVENFDHFSVGKGKSAIDKAVVDIRINGKTVRGQGLSTDTVKAAGLAYLDACKRAETAKAEKQRPVDN